MGDSLLRALGEAQIAQTKQTVTDAKLQGMVADLGTQAGASELFEQVPDVDILVNNLGIYGSQAFADISNDEGIQLRLEFRFQP